MSLAKQTHKRRHGDDSSDWVQASQRQRSSASSSTTTTLEQRSSLSPATQSFDNFAAPILPRIIPYPPASSFPLAQHSFVPPAHASLSLFPPASLPVPAPPPQSFPLSIFSSPSSVSSSSSSSSSFSARSSSPVFRRPSDSRSSDVICVDDDEDGSSFPVFPILSTDRFSDVICVEDDEDCDNMLSRAIAASVADSFRAAASLSHHPHLSLSHIEPNPPSPSNSVVYLYDDLPDNDECMVVESSSSFFSPFASSSVAHLPLSPSRWANLPVDLLALICTFQFSSGRRSLAADNSAMYGQQQSGRPDDSMLSIRQLTTMCEVCLHWFQTIKPPAEQPHKAGCLEVDCWSGVQQLEIKQSGKHIHVGGVRVKRKKIAHAVATLDRLHSLSLEFNVHYSAADDTDFDLLLPPGHTVTVSYPHLRQLTIRLVQNYVQERQHSRRAARAPAQQQPLASSLFENLSTWLDCHPKLRSFAFIDPLAATYQPMPMPMPQPFIPPFVPPPIPPPPPPVLQVRGRGRRVAGRARRAAAPAPPLVVPVNPMPHMQPFLLQMANRMQMLGAPFAPFPPPLPFGFGGAGQPAYRAPRLPQPKAAALRLLCTGRLQHLSLAGETMERLAYGDDEQKERKEEKEGDEARQCFRADDVQSVALMGDYSHQRYIDALYDALPSLTLLDLRWPQSARGMVQLLAKVGPRITFLRGSMMSLSSSLSLPTTAVHCSNLQSLYIQPGNQPEELYAALPSLPSLIQLSIIEPRQPGSVYAQHSVMHNLPEHTLPPLPNLLYLHLQLSSYRAFPLVANRQAKPSSILPAKLTHLVLSIAGQQLVPHLSSVPVLCPLLSHCHINSGASVTSQTWEARLTRLKARLGGVWRESESEVVKARLDVAWRAS